MPPGRELSRVLGLWDATCVVVGAIIGVGIFFNPRDVANVTGSARAALAAWGIGGVIALLGAFTFAELGRLKPVAGGQYHVLRDAYGRPPAFLFVFCNLTAVQAGAVAIIAIVCAQNLGVALHGAAPSERWVLAIATLLTWALVGVNVIGVRSGAGLQDATVVAKLITLGALVALAAALAPGRAAAPAEQAAAGTTPLTFSMLFAGVTLTLFAYGGWQQALWVAGEVTTAHHTVPRAILLGVAIVVLAYLGANWAYLELLGFSGVRGATTLAADAFSVASPGLGRRIAAFAVAVSAFGVLNAQFLTGPRLTWAMAKDGLFFASAARLHPRYGSPAWSIAAQALWSGALLFSHTYGQLLQGTMFAEWTFFALIGLSLFVFAAREPGFYRGAGERVLIVASAVGFTAVAAAVVGNALFQSPRQALVGVAVMLAGLPVYAMWRGRRSAAGRLGRELQE